MKRKKLFLPMIGFGVHPHILGGIPGIAAVNQRRHTRVTRNQPRGGQKEEPMNR